MNNETSPGTHSVVHSCGRCDLTDVVTHSVILTIILTIMISSTPQHRYGRRVKHFKVDGPLLKSSSESGTSWPAGITIILISVC